MEQCRRCQLEFYRERQILKRLFVKCHVYYNSRGGKPLKFELRPFIIYVFAIDAQELDFGKSVVDLSLMIRESMEKSYKGTRVRQRDTVFKLSGKAKGRELVLKLGFQIMEKDGGRELYSQSDGLKSGRGGDSSSSFASKQSKSSFSIPSPKLSSRAEETGPEADFHGIGDLNLDEPAPSNSTPPPINSTPSPPSVRKCHERD